MREWVTWWLRESVLELREWVYEWQREWVNSQLRDCLKNG